MEPPVGLCQRAFEDIVFWFAFDAHNDLCFPLIPKMTAPASALRMHANTTVFLDTESAALLSSRRMVQV